MRFLLNFLLTLWLILLFILSGCSFDYRAATEGEDLAETIPDTILFNFEHRIIQGNQLLFMLMADKATVYEKKAKTVLEGIYFVEYDEKGKIVIEGWADHAIFHTETEDAEIDGSIYVFSEQEEGGIEADSLIWKKEGKQLTAKPGAQVVLKKEDGSYIQGEGFNADFKNKVISLESDIKGLYIDEEDEED